MTVSSGRQVCSDSHPGLPRPLARGRHHCSGCSLVSCRFSPRVVQSHYLLSCPPSPGMSGSSPILDLRSSFCHRSIFSCRLPSRPRQKPIRNVSTVSPSLRVFAARGGACQCGTLQREQLHLPGCAHDHCMSPLCQKRQDKMCVENSDFLSQRSLATRYATKPSRVRKKVARLR